MNINIKASPTDTPGNWVVLEDLEHDGVLVPEGFHFDGASVPWVLQWIFKKGGLVFAPAALHDFLYRTAEGSRKVADLIFLNALLYNGVGTLKAKLMYLGVRIGGWITWRANKTNTQKKTV